jgi:CO dehydrogenase nickel-insertion accessory protein CooC1
MSRTILAVCGKGGVGKTTVAALIARHLAQQKRRALLVDADPAGGLAMALHFTPRQTINDVRRQTVRELRKAASTNATCRFVRLPRAGIAHRARRTGLSAHRRPEEKAAIARSIVC